VPEATCLPQRGIPTMTVRQRTLPLMDSPTLPATRNAGRLCVDKQATVHNLGAVGVR